MADELLEDKPKADQSLWRIDKREVLHTNPWYEYRHDAGVTDHGKPFNYYYVYRRCSVAVVALTEDNRVVLVRQYRYLLNQEMLQLPGGGMEDAGDSEDLARRELLEETGYQPAAVRHLIDLPYALGYAVDQQAVFLATGCRRVREPNLEDTELSLRVELYAPAEVFAMIERGEMTDSQGVAALAIARPHLP
ncbi:MAG: NUDIX hydrolase [Parcubacteria group bacterium]|nr:NUDIX hydrolase [Parcubacteria group bacterium]